MSKITISVGLDYHQRSVQSCRSRRWLDKGSALGKQRETCSPEVT